MPTLKGDIVEAVPEDLAEGFGIYLDELKEDTQARLLSYWGLDRQSIDLDKPIAIFPALK